MTSRFTRTIPTCRMFDSRQSQGVLHRISRLQGRLRASLRAGPAAVHADIAGRRRPVSERTSRRLFARCQDCYRNHRARRIPRRSDGEAIRLCPPRARRAALGCDHHDHRRSVLQSHRVQRAPARHSHGSSRRNRPHARITRSRDRPPRPAAGHGGFEDRQGGNPAQGPAVSVPEGFCRAAGRARP